MRRLFLLTLCSLVFLMALSQCAQKKQASLYPSKPERPVKLLIAPFERTTEQEPVCPICGQAMKGCKFSADPERTLETILRDELEKSGLVLVEEEIVQKELLELEKEKISFSTGKKLWMELGKKTKAEIIVFGSVSCYQERQGSSFAVTEPPKAGFHLHWVNVYDGKEIFSTSYFEEQKPLSENIFELSKFIERRGKWIKVDELAREGIKKSISEFLISMEKEDEGDPGN